MSQVECLQQDRGDDMETSIKSLHHVTATVGNAQEDLDFYARLLGLRLVKRTVNFDNTGVYHFYYGTRQGAPGTIMTTFPYEGKGVRIGEKGAGQVTVTSFSVPEGSLEFWTERLMRNGIAVQKKCSRLGDEVIGFDDPTGLALELIACDDDARVPWTTEEIGSQEAIRGIFSVTLVVTDLDPTQKLLEEVLGFEIVGSQRRRTRFGIRNGGAGRILDVQHVPDATPGVNGIGTVHHVALDVETAEEQRTIQDELRRRGHSVTDVRDRQYFQSIYFREPGGVLLEVATAGPGFLIDEAEDALGRELRLPPWEEHRRAQIAAELPEIKV